MDTSAPPPKQDPDTMGAHDLSMEVTIPVQGDAPGQSTTSSATPSKSPSTPHLSPVYATSSGVQRPASYAPGPYPPPHVYGQSQGYVYMPPAPTDPVLGGPYGGVYPIQSSIRHGMAHPPSFPLGTPYPHTYVPLCRPPRPVAPGTESLSYAPGPVDAAALISQIGDLVARQVEITVKETLAQVKVEGRASAHRGAVKSEGSSSCNQLESVATDLIDLTEKSDSDDVILLDDDTGSGLSTVTIPDIKVEIGKSPQRNTLNLFDIDFYGDCTALDRDVIDKAALDNAESDVDGESNGSRNPFISAEPGTSTLTEEGTAMPATSTLTGDDGLMVLGDGPIECKICRRRFVNRKALHLHKQTHRPVTKNGERKDFSCDMCKTYFMNKASFLHHKKAVHMMYHIEPGVKCAQCDRAFSSKSFLQNHMDNLHQPVAKDGRRKRFVCPACPSFFIYRSSFGSHLKEIHGMSAKGLGPPEARHTHGHKPLKLRQTYPCKKCKRCFTPGALKRHMLTIHNPFIMQGIKKKYCCQICSSFFNNITGLCTHNRTLHRAPKLRPPSPSVEPLSVPFSSTSSVGPSVSTHSTSAVAPSVSTPSTSEVAD